MHFGLGLKEEYVNRHEITGAQCVDTMSKNGVIWFLGNRDHWNKLFTLLHSTDKKNKTQIVKESGLESMSFLYRITNRAYNIIGETRTRIRWGGIR